MGAYERRRGATFELEIAELMREQGWPHARRTQDGRAQERGDLANGPAGFVFELKRTERLRIREAWKQADGCALPHEIPVVVTRWDRGPALAIVELGELLPLARVREGGLFR